MRALAAACVVLAAACQAQDAPIAAPAASNANTPAPAPAPAKHPGKLEMIDATAPTDLAADVAAQMARAKADGKQLAVYVGASWCEPCQHFHAAAAAGELDDQFGDLRLIAYDNDRDAAALDAAGYRSAMIPLFALPGADGHASGMQIAGSIKGDGAVTNIAPRLRQLLDNGAEFGAAGITPR